MQKQILTEFMSEHSNLTKGVLPNTYHGKATANRLWETLTNKLNASGPPLKDVKTWRKVYSDQKQMVKKKLSYNKSSIKKTGGGPFDEKPLSVADEQILEAAGLDVAVAGLQEVRTFGSQNQQHKEIDDNTYSLFGKPNGSLVTRICLLIAFISHSLSDSDDEE